MREDDTLAYNIHSNDNGITSRALSAVKIYTSHTLSVDLMLSSLEAASIEGYSGPGESTMACYEMEPE